MAFDLPYVHNQQPIEDVVYQWLEQVGYPILHVRTNTRMRCYCYDPIEGDMGTGCPTCLGTGWTPEVVRRKVVSNVEAVPETLARLMRDADFGQVSVDARSFLVSTEYPVHNGDLFIITSFDRFHRPVDEYMEFYEVNYSVVFRDNHGKPVMFHSYSRADLLDVPYRSIQTREYSVDPTSEDDESLSLDLRTQIKKHQMKKKLSYYVVQE